MSFVRRVRSKIRRTITAWGQSGGPVRRSVYHRLFDVNMHDEQRAVGAGIAQHRRLIGTGEELYLLRRNIHRLEKALTMRPLRNQFALKFIQETVEAYVSVVNGANTSGWLASEEYKWATSVLLEYFEATRSSNTPLIQRLENDFLTTRTDSDGSDCEHGPSTPPDSEVPVQYDDLLALAERRRSIRWYEDRPVAREIVDNAIRVAQESPTACNRQPYRFLIFDDKESARRVASVPGGTVGFSHQIPNAIVAVGDLSAFFDARDRHLIYIDGSLAIMGLILGFESQGIATCTINWPDVPEQNETMKKLIGLKDYERVIMLIAYGYADSTALTPFSSKSRIEDARTYLSLKE